MRTHALHFFLKNDVEASVFRESADSVTVGYSRPSHASLGLVKQNVSKRGTGSTLVVTKGCGISKHGQRSGYSGVKR